MTISLPWGKEQADYVAGLLRDRAQSRVDLARDIGGGSLVKGFRSDLAANAIMIEGLVADLRAACAMEHDTGPVAEVTEERGEDLAGEEDLRDNGGGPGGLDA